MTLREDGSNPPEGGGTPRERERGSNPPGAFPLRAGAFPLRVGAFPLRAGAFPLRAGAFKMLILHPTGGPGGGPGGQRAPNWCPIERN